MNFCQANWDRLKHAIYSRGLNDFVAPDGKALLGQIEEQFKDPDILTLENFDPLFAANNMIFSQFLKDTGLAALAPDPETGKPPCPLCSVAKTRAGLDENWIQGAADNAAEMVAELRKGPVNLKETRAEAERRGGSA